MAFNAIIQQILSLFIIIFIGYYGGKKQIINESFSNGLSKLLIQITIPLLIISSFSNINVPGIASNILKSFSYGLIIYILTAIIVKPLFLKIERSRKNILQFAMVFSNCGFMGFPIARIVFGDEGIIYTSIFNVVFTIFVWTYGVMLFSETKSIGEFKKILKNPGIIAVLIGLMIMLFSKEIPVILYNTMEIVGGLTTPISMLIIGSLLSRSDLNKLLKDSSLYYASFIKLILIPGVLYSISILFKENSMVIKVFILLQAMPAGAMTSIFAENFNKEKEYSALIVSLSTLLSVVTIPLIIKFFL